MRIELVPIPSEMLKMMEKHARFEALRQISRKTRSTTSSSIERANSTRSRNASAYEVVVQAVPAADDGENDDVFEIEVDDGVSPAASMHLLPTARISDPMLRQQSTLV